MWISKWFNSPSWLLNLPLVRLSEYPGYSSASVYFINHQLIITILFVCSCEFTLADSLLLALTRSMRSLSWKRWSSHNHSAAAAQFWSMRPANLFKFLLFIGSFVLIGVRHAKTSLVNQNNECNRFCKNVSWCSRNSRSLWHFWGWIRSVLWTEVFMLWRYI